MVIWDHQQYIPRYFDRRSFISASHLLPADVPTATAAADVAPTDAALHCSMAVLPTPQADSAMAAGAASGAFQALVSAGKGDLLLLSSSPTQPGGFPWPLQSAQTPQER